MITIVPAAGKSQRFKNKYLESKQFLPMPCLGDRVIWHVMNDLPGQIHIVANQRDRENWHKIYGGSVLFVNETKGPLDTTIQGLSRFQFVYPDQELLIAYSDVIFGGYGRFLHYVRSRPCIRAAVVFKSDNPRFGYTPDGLMAYAGIFWFASFNDFLTKAVEVNDIEVGIPSVIEPNSHTNYYVINENQRIDLGTPEDYESYMAVCQEVE